MRSAVQQHVHTYPSALTYTLFSAALAGDRRLRQIGVEASKLMDDWLRYQGLSFSIAPHPR